MKDPQWPEKFPFRDDMFARYDETADSSFYTEPRFVTHIDDNAIKALTQHYEREFPRDGSARQQTAVLDMCSSWISHYPPGFTASRVAGACAFVRLQHIYRIDASA